MNRYETVAEALENIGRWVPQNGFTFQDMKGEETRFGFEKLAEETARRGAALQALGLSKGDRFGLIVIEPEDFVLTFLSALRVGIVPVPLYPPLSFGALDAYAERTARVLELSGARVLVASSRLQNILWSLVDQVTNLDRLVKVEELREGTELADRVEIHPDDLAFLQYTSGSTADPKGVMVTHRSLVANAQGIMVHGLQTTHDDVGVSWLPLYHDMGLIGFVISPVIHGVSVVFIPTIRFIKRPSCWMETVHRHRGTISFGPNFSYALAARKAKEEQLNRWDLTSLRVLGCGAEPIQPETMRAFTELFHTRCNMPKAAIMPAYGMAESTLAISLKTAPEVMVTHHVHLERFQEEGAVEAPVEGELAVEHVSCGVPFPGHQVVVMDLEGNTLGERREGELCLKGPSVTPGYFENPEATAAAFRDGWLHTGDLGYLRDGQVYVTGRIKDLIILNGRNLHPQQIEWAAAEVDGVRKGNVVAFSRPGATSEEVVVALETRNEDHAALSDLVKRAVRKEISVSPAEVICLAPGTLPKTSSGKLQRRKTRAQYLDGRLGLDGNRTVGANGSKRVIARHVARSVWSRAKSALTR